MMSIGELAEQTGVSRRTIRYYEELGILPEAQRSDGGTRRYPDEYRFYVQAAVALKELGFVLDEISLLARFARGARLTKKERAEAEHILADRMNVLEHRIQILHRIRDILVNHTDLEDRPSAERLPQVLSETSAMLREKAARGA